MKEKITEVKSAAEQFGEIARKVNESSVMRKTYAEDVIKLSDDVKRIMDDLYHAITKITESNEAWCQQDSKILSMCRKLVANIKLQGEQLKKMSEQKSGSGDLIAKMLTVNASMNESVKKVIDNLNDALGMDLEITQMDRFLVKKKERQLNELNLFKKMTMSILDDALTAIAGSAENGKRGAALVEQVQSVESLLAGKKTAELEKLICDAYTGWNTAAQVNKRSATQHDFATMVEKFMNSFHDESLSLKNIVIKKHSIFEQCLQIVSVYIVYISMDFKKYIGIEESLEQLAALEKNSNGIGDLKYLIDEAISIVKELLVMNIDMTLISHVDNEFETMSIESTDKEIAIFDAMRSLVAKMSQASAYPVEGSAKNIENGKKIEQLLREITKLDPKCN